MSGVVVRRYRAEDWDAVAQICVESGLGGQLEQYFCDGPAFARLWLRPYLRSDPESCFVAEIGGEVVGYLVGKVRAPAGRFALAAIGPAFAILRNFLTGKYRHHPPSKQFVRYLWLRAWREIPRRHQNAAEFHFNVRESAQGDPEIGPKLMRAFFDHALGLGVTTLNIQVFLREGLRTHRFYARLGMRLVDLCACTMFSEPALAATYAIPIPTGDLFAGRARVPKLIAVSPRPLAKQVISADEVVSTMPAQPASHTLYLPIAHPASPYAVAFALRERTRFRNNERTWPGTVAEEN